MIRSFFICERDGSLVCHGGWKRLLKTPQIQNLVSLQELSQLRTVVGNTDVVLFVDNRDVNMDGIIEEVRQEYEAIAQRSKAEVDAMYQGRVSRHQ